MLERSLTMIAIGWEGTFWDSSVVPRYDGIHSSRCVLLVAVAGEMKVWGDDWEVVLAHPGDAVWLSEAEFEGASNERSVWHQATSKQHRRLEIRVAKQDVGINCAMHKIFSVADDVLGHVNALLAEQSTQKSITEHVQQIVQRLQTDRQINARLAETIVAEESATMIRLWGSLQRSLEALDFRPTTKEIASQLGLSLRQTGRDLLSLQTMVYSPFGGFRTTFLILRLRFAILLLHSGVVSMSEVARRAGYGSTQAMSHAFRHAGVHSPEVFLEHGRRFRMATSSDFIE